MILTLSDQLLRNLITSHWNRDFMINCNRGEHLQFQRLFSPRRPYRVVHYWKSLPIVLRTSIGDRLGEFCLKYLKGSCSPFLMELKLNNTMIVTTMEVMAIKKSLECQKRFTKAYPMALIGSWCPLLVSIVIGVAVALASLSSLFESGCKHLDLCIL